MTCFPVYKKSAKLRKLSTSYLERLGAESEIAGRILVYCIPLHPSVLIESGPSIAWPSTVYPQELQRFRKIIDSPPLGLSDKWVNGSGSRSPGRSENSNRCRRHVATSVISVNANCAPTQARGPVPKGKYTNGESFLSFSPKKRTGSKRSGSGNHRSSRWVT